MSSQTERDEPIIPLDKIERAIILDALERLEGNRTHTAKALGISLQCLRGKLRLYAEQGFNITKVKELGHYYARKGA